MTPLPGIYHKNPETLIQKNILCPPMFIVRLITIVNIWKQPRCPSVDEWPKNKNKNKKPEMSLGFFKCYDIYLKKILDTYEQ